MREEEKLYAVIRVPTSLVRGPRFQMPSINLRPKINNVRTRVNTGLTNFGNSVRSKVGIGLSGFGNRISSNFNNLKSNIGTRFTNFGNKIGTEFTNLRSKVGNGLTNFGSKVNGGFNNFKDTLSAKFIRSTGGINKVQKPQISTAKPTTTDISRVIGVKPISQNLITNPNITTQNQNILNNLNKSQNTITVPRKYNPSADPKMYHKDPTLTRARDLSSNHARGQAYYDSVFKETGANANSTYNITTSRKDLMNQMKPATPQTTTTTTNKPQGIVDNKTVGFNEAKSKLPQQPTTSNSIEKNIDEFVNMDKGNMKVETPKQPAEKPFEITGLAEQQPKPQTTSPTVESTGEKKYKIARVGKDEKGNLKIEQPSKTTVNPPVENTNPNPQTSTPAEQPKPEVKPENKPDNPPQNPENPTTTTDPNKKKEDEKFKLGWKGKAALGLGGLGLATYGAGKLVKNVLDDDD